MTGLNYLSGRLTSWYFAARIARKHVANWFSLLVKTLFRLDGKFVSRAGGKIACNSHLLLKQLVRLENEWQANGDVLPIIKFGSDTLTITNYFGRDFIVPLKSSGIASPSFFIKKYSFNVKDEIVLDIGAYLGDTPLLWLKKGAKQVIAVEPLPFHFHFLVKNTSGLPVECLNFSVGSPIPNLPHVYGSMSYGLTATKDEVEYLPDVPCVSLIELVKSYKPTVVKLNCEGCEHFILEELAELPSYGVKTVVVDFHDIEQMDAYSSYGHLRDKIGEGEIIYQKVKINWLGGKSKRVTVVWNK